MNRFALLVVLPLVVSIDGMAKEMKDFVGRYSLQSSYTTKDSLVLCGGGLEIFYDDLAAAEGRQVLFLNTVNQHGSLIQSRVELGDRRFTSRDRESVVLKDDSVVETRLRKSGWFSKWKPVLIRHYTHEERDGLLVFSIDEWMPGKSFVTRCEYVAE